MKLGELRAALRNHKGKVYVEAVVQGLNGPETVQVPVQKTEFIKDTLAKFGEHKNSETGLTLEGDRVVREGGATAVPQPLPTPETEPDHLNEDDDPLPNGGGDPQPITTEEDFIDHLNEDDDLLPNGGGDPQPITTEEDFIDLLG